LIFVILAGTFGLAPPVSTESLSADPEPRSSSSSEEEDVTEYSEESLSVKWTFGLAPPASIESLSADFEEDAIEFFGFTPLNLFKASLRIASEEAFLDPLSADLKPPPADITEDCESPEANGTFGIALLNLSKASLRIESGVLLATSPEGLIEDFFEEDCEALADAAPN
jgi:hypothetical protein